jgi:dTDP-4-amino-4,6-dideoxygalactose transaminase
MGGPAQKREGSPRLVTTPEGSPPGLPRAALRAAYRVLHDGTADSRLLSSELGGGVVGEFEGAFADLVGARYAVACASGTTALIAALVACGVRSGSEVIVASYGWSGTVGAVLTLGARPVFADVDPRTFTLDPERVLELVNNRTVAILATHLFGHPAHVSRLAEVARSHNLRLIYDAAQALGATYQGLPMGACGDLSAFSFGRGKILSAGEGGMAVTNDPAIFDQLLLASQHPARAMMELGDTALRPLADGMSLSCRMHPVAAALGLAQVAGLPSLVRRRRRTCLDLAYRLRNLQSLIAPSEAPSVEHAFHRFVLRLRPEITEDRARAVAALRRLGVPAIRGPICVPIHRHARFCSANLLAIQTEHPSPEQLPITCALSDREELLLESSSDWLSSPEARITELATALIFADHCLLLSASDRGTR